MTRRLDPEAVRWGSDGLIPAVVQDRSDGRVLMLAWQDREALEATLATGDVHFHSRSRDALWRKGETSGNVLHLVSAELDCDGDALLIQAHPAGPTCHTGARSCFDVGGSIKAETEPEVEAEASAGAQAAAKAPTQGFDWLETLWSTIHQRAVDRPEGSYTAELLGGGVDSVARKVTEEATEVLIAAKDDASAADADTRVALTGELADLVYHSLVLMAERGLAPAEVIAVLRERHSG